MVDDMMAAFVLKGRRSCLSIIAKLSAGEFSDGFEAGSYLIFKPQLGSQLRVSAAPRELFITHF
jgi:hypothetical protein